MTRTRKRIAAAVLVISVVVTLAFIAGSFVDYAPPIAGTEMQNIYLRRIVRFGIALIALQLTAVALLLTGRTEDALG